MNFHDRYHMSEAESRFLARKKWDENVYCGMRMENRAVTFPQTRTILDGVNVPDVRLDDIQAILNMRDAWRFTLETWGQPVTLEWLCLLNGHIARNEALEWGKLRYGGVAISGTDYKPPIPDETAVRERLAAVLSANGTATDKALELFAWGTRSQLFWDGNKRTSLVLANKLLLEAGAGMMTITDRHLAGFNERLIGWYESGDAAALKQYLYDYAIFGIDLEA